MWMVVGLGNPGSKYERNRHNVGFFVVDALASQHGFGEWKRGGKMGGDSTTGHLVTPAGRVKVLLVKPMEFMNLSGFAVQRFADFHDVEVDKIVVVHDELDLAPFKVKVKQGGGTAESGLVADDENGACIRVGAVRPVDGGEEVGGAVAGGEALLGVERPAECLGGLLAALGRAGNDAQVVRRVGG